MGEIPDRPRRWASDPKDLDEQRSSSTLPFVLLLACDARPLTAFCQTTLGGIYARRGDHDQRPEIRRRRRLQLPGTWHATARRSIRSVRRIRQSRSVRNPLFHPACSWSAETQF